MALKDDTCISVIKLVSYVKFYTNIILFTGINILVMNRLMVDLFYFWQ